MPQKSSPSIGVHAVSTAFGAVLPGNIFIGHPVGRTGSAVLICGLAPLAHKCPRVCISSRVHFLKQSRNAPLPPNHVGAVRRAQTVPVPICAPPDRQFLATVTIEVGAHRLVAGDPPVDIK